MQRAFLLSLFILASGCFKTDQQKILERLNSFAQDFSYQGPAPVFSVIKKSSGLTKNLTKDFKLEIEVREAIFKSQNSKQFQQNYMLLRKMVSELQVVFKAPRLTPREEGYLAKTTIEIRGRERDSSNKLAESIFYEFFLEKREGQWLIATGRNEPIFE